MGMKIKLYHGSPVIIRKPQFGIGKTYNDYGQGFYCTESLDLAKEWSVDEGRDGFANVYSLETDGLNVVRLNESPFCIMHWLSVLLLPWCRSGFTTFLASARGCLSGMAVRW